jgi:hypothetical protein
MANKADAPKNLRLKMPEGLVLVVILSEAKNLLKQVVRFQVSGSIA